MFATSMLDKDLKHHILSIIRIIKFICMYKNVMNIYIIKNTIYNIIYYEL